MGRVDIEVRRHRIWCLSCGKWSYGNRKSAKKARSALDDALPMNVYRCPVGVRWHIGSRDAALAAWIRGAPRDAEH